MYKGVTVSLLDNNGLVTLMWLLWGNLWSAEFRRYISSPSSLRSSITRYWVALNLRPSVNSIVWITSIYPNFLNFQVANGPCTNSGSKECLQSISALSSQHREKRVKSNILWCGWAIPQVHFQVTKECLCPTQQTERAR